MIQASLKACKTVAISAPAPGRPSVDSGGNPRRVSIGKQAGLVQFHPVKGHVSGIAQRKGHIHVSLARGEFRCILAFLFSADGFVIG